MASDQQKGKLFSKISREIMLAVSIGGGVTDPDNNIYLRSALQRAHEVNMPKDTIHRLVERIASRKELMTEVVYEAMAWGGVSLVIKTATDNPRRTVAELSSYLEKQGAKMVEKGAVLYQYDLCGVFWVEGKTEEEVLSLVEALDGFDMEQVDAAFYIYVLYDKLSKALQKAKQEGLHNAPELIYRPKSYMPLSIEQAQKITALIEGLEELDDVQSVYTNAQFPPFAP